MIKDISYIIKRIIIGVGIALTLMFLKGNFLLGVNAMTVNGQNVGSQVWSVNPTTNYWYVYKSINGYWNGWGPGYIYFNIGIMKVSTDSVAPLVSPKSIVLSTSTSDFACSFDSSSVNNSTYINQHYSVTCPVDLTNSGLNGMTINLMPNNNTPIDTFEINFDGYMTFVNDSSSFVNNNSGVIDSQNNNATANNNNRDANFGNLINDNRANTQAIINNDNANTDKEIESQKVCTRIDNSSISLDNKYLSNSQGLVSDSQNYGITDYIPVINSSITVTTIALPNNGPYLCFYNVNKSLVSCIANNTLTLNQVLTIPTSASYVRFSINKANNKPQFEICTNGNQAIVDSQKEINNTLNNDNVDGANSQASSFFDNFQANSHGLSGIVTAPLRLIESLSSSTCSALVLPLPFVSQNATLPCMSTVYNQFPTFYSLWQLITTGMIAYYILIKLFGHVKGMQNPNDDRIEVLNL